MSILQLRGITGINPKRNQTQEAIGRSMYLPSMIRADQEKSYQERALNLSEQANKQSHKYYDKMAGISEDAADAAESDRNRGMWMQGGMLGVQALPILSEAMGGPAESVASGAGKALDTFVGSASQPLEFAKAGDAMAVGGGVDIPGIGGIAGGLANVGMGIQDHVLDPVVEGAKRFGGAISEGASDLWDWASGLFS